MMASASTGTFTGWATAILPVIQSPDWPVPMDQSQVAWILSIHFLGSIAGAIPAGILMEKFGRKPALLIPGLTLPLTSWLLVSASTSLVSSSTFLEPPSNPLVSSSNSLISSSNSLVSAATPGSWYLLLVARLIAGIWNGVVTTVSPIYLAEIAEPNSRGRLNTLVALSFRLGNLFAILASLVFSFKTLPLILSMFSIIFLLVFPFFPETPYYYMKQEKYRCAEASLKWLRYSRLQHTQLKAELQSAVQTQVQSEPKIGLQMEVQSKSRIETQIEVQSEQKIGLQTKVQSEIQVEVQSELKTGLYTEVQSKLKTGLQMEVQSELKTGPQKQIQSKPQLVVETVVQSEPNTGLHTEVQPEPHAEPHTTMHSKLETELNSIKESVNKQMQQQKTKFLQKFKSKTTIKSLFIVETLSILLRMAGVAPIINYVADSLPGSNILNPNFFVFFIEGTRLLSSLLSSMVIDKLQRRMLLIGTSMICGCSMAIMAVLYWFDDYNVQKFIVGLDMERNRQFLNPMPQGYLDEGSGMLNNNSRSRDNNIMMGSMLERDNLNDAVSNISENIRPSRINYWNGKNDDLKKANMSDSWRNTGESGRNAKDKIDTKKNPADFEYIQRTRKDKRNTEKNESEFKEIQRNAKDRRNTEESWRVFKDFQWVTKDKRNTQDNQRVFEDIQENTEDIKINNKDSQRDLKDIQRNEEDKIYTTENIRNFEYIQRNTKDEINIEENQRNFEDIQKNIKELQINIQNRRNVEENLRELKEIQRNIEYTQRNNEDSQINTKNNHNNSKDDNQRNVEDIETNTEDVRRNSEDEDGHRNTEYNHENTEDNQRNFEDIQRKPKDSQKNLAKNILHFLQWVPSTCIIIHGISYSFGVATVCSNIRSELFPMHIKGECSAITSIITAFTSFTLSRSFPLTRDYVGLYFNFAIYAFSSFMIALFAKFFLPETTGKTLQQIQDELDARFSGKEGQKVTGQEMKDNFKVV